MTASRRSPDLLFLVMALALSGACAQAAVEPQAGGPTSGGGGGAGGSDAGRRGPNDAPAFIPDPVDAPTMPRPPTNEACATESKTAEMGTAELLFVVDVSGSMNGNVAGAGSPTKWALAREAIVKFMSDQGSSGLSVALKFFPVQKKCSGGAGGLCTGPNYPPGTAGNCDAIGRCASGLTCVAGKCKVSGAMCANVGELCMTNTPGDVCEQQEFPCGSSCDLADYQKLAMPFASLPGALDMLNATLDANAPNAMSSGTPTWHAVSTGLTLLREHLGQGEGRRGALVLVTDGEPTLCNPILPNGMAGTFNDITTITSVVEAARTAAPGITTYAVGVFTDKDFEVDPKTMMTHDAILTKIATAGGTQPFIIKANADLTRALQDTFSKIRALAVPCDYGIPMPDKGALDYGKVNVHVKTKAGEEDLPYVRSADKCDQARGGWYYDADPAAGGKPTRVVVCASACKALQGDQSTKVDLRFGCMTRVAD